MIERSNLWQKGIVYQVYPRSFKDSNDDGIGDILGIIEKLDYIKELGADIIWLSPVYASPNDDNGYDISDYYKINPEYGTMEDMDLLIVEAMKRGLRIIMDLVINHTSDEHPWFIESKKKDSPYRDYYIWKEKPNNWTSFFSGPAWTKVDDSYYLHLFSPKQPDLNWNNPKVYDEIKNIMIFWLNKGIYGFRCDVINIIYKSSLEDGKKRLVLTGREHYHSQEGCHKILNRLRTEVLDLYDQFTVGETVMVSTKQANDLILPERKELDMVFSFEHMEVDQINNKWFKTKFKPKKLYKVISTWQKEAYWNANYLENHDQPRSVSRFGNDKDYHDLSAKALAVLNLSLKGTPYIFQGQEIGMTNGDFKSMDEYMDVETHRIYHLAKKLRFPKWYIKKMIERTSRDNARTPMQWSKEGGFSHEKPWLKQNENKKMINVEDSLKNRDSILCFYQRLIQFRKTHDVMLNGDFKPLYMNRSIFVFERAYQGKSFVIMVNLNLKTSKIPLKIDGKIVLKNDESILEHPTHLKAYQACIIEREGSYDNV